MSDGNCNCCCAYLTPPWWVTMGYVPPIRSQGQGSPAPQTSSTSAARPATQGTVVQAPSARPQATSVAPTVTGPTVSREVATGNLVSAIGDAMHLL
jgi:hypothetical protein